MDAPKIYLFGTGQIQGADGALIPMRARKQLALLAYLLLEAPHPQSREAVMALLWPEFDTNTARNNLRVTLSAVRSLFATADSANLIQSSRLEIHLNPDMAYWLDVAEFDALLRRTRQHQHDAREHCPHCYALLQEAAALYQSDFLAGFALDNCPDFEEWLVMQRERLRVSAIKTYQDLAVFAENGHDLQMARTFIHQQLELDPLRESAYRQQMRVLAKLGERSAALATFERCRTLLRQELGIDPDPETLALHLQLLDAQQIGPESTHNGAPAAEITVPATPRHNLPQQLTSFVGRQQELDLLDAHLAMPTNRLLTIVGPGGIGKSRLAQQVAARHLNRFVDGVYLISLAQVSAVESMPAAIADTLGLSFTAGPQSANKQLVEMIGDKQLLLVLDNFEHLMDGVDLLLELLRQTTHLVLLVTTRERLNMQAEDLFELRGLAVPTNITAAAKSAAVRLFADRASRINKEFVLTDAQLPYVVRICQLVEGFPLAIELAATWLRDLDCQEIVAELSMGLNHLHTSLRDVDPQHSSLGAVFDSSWRLLSPLEQRVLADLTVFRGGFHLDAARAVTSASSLLLSGLRNKSLLRRVNSRRYDMHMLIQQFAAAYLANDAPLAAQARQDHSRYFMELLAAKALALDTDEAGAAADMIQPEWENITAAWRHAVAHSEFGLLAAALDGLVRFGDLRGLFHEVQTLMEFAAIPLRQKPACVQPESSPAEADPAARQEQLLYCRLITALAYFAGRKGEESTLELAQHALVLARKLDSKIDIIANRVTQAAAFELAADFAKARTLAQEALAIAEQEGLDLQIGLCLDGLGIIALHSGDYSRARNLFLQVRAIHEKTGRLEQRGREAIGRLGIVATEQGRYDLALQYTRRYLESCRRMHDRRNTPHAQHHLAFAWLKLGDFKRVVELETQSLAQSIHMGDLEQQSFSLHNKAHAHRQLGQLESALACATKAVALARTIDAPLCLAFALAQLAEVQVELAQTDAAWAEAAANFGEAAILARSIGKLTVAYEVEIGLAALALRRQHDAAALAQIVPLLPHLPTKAADGWDEPIRAYVVCTRVLRSARDPAAETILQQGLQLLAYLAGNIADEKLRQSFLHAVPAHDELHTLLHAQNVAA
ncbi:MAG: AAA family ATPase [Caldilineaceae bacterium]|nr:AAA family ATPase [Caldilineaceae bacterium]